MPNFGRGREGESFTYLVGKLENAADAEMARAMDGYDGGGLGQFYEFSWWSGIIQSGSGWFREISRIKWANGVSIWDVFGYLGPI